MLSKKKKGYTTLVGIRLLFSPLSFEASWLSWGVRCGFERQVASVYSGGGHTTTQAGRRAVNVVCSEIEIVFGKVQGGGKPVLVKGCMIHAAMV